MCHRLMVVRSVGAVVAHLRQHRLSSTRRAVQEHTARWVDTDLRIEIRIGQRKLDSLSDFLLLHVKATDIGIRNVRLLAFLYNVRTTTNLHVLRLLG